MSTPVAYAIDFGTSNSSIAIAYEDREEVVAVEPKGSLPESLPSILYLHRSGQRSAGTEAVQQFLVTGARRTRCGECDLVDRWNGNVETNCRTYRSGGFCMDSRLMSSLKSFMSEPHVKTHSWASDFNLPGLTSIIIGALKQKADAVTGGGVTRLMLGHPVAFEGTEGQGFEQRQSAALKNLTSAAEAVGFEEIGLFPEPSAAVINESIPEGAVLALDFGGGTFDVAVIEMKGDEGEVTALQGAAIGGGRFDSLIFDCKVAQALGLTSEYQGSDGRTERFPSSFRNGMRSLSGIAGLLSNGDTGPTLRRFIARDGKALEMVDRILYEGHAYALHSAIEEAKIQLSTQDEAIIRLERPGISLNVSITQAEFTEILAPDLAILRECIGRALDQANKEPSQIELVVRTGGSSRIKPFVAMLHDLFGRDRVVERHLFNTVVMGLAAEARREWAPA